MFRVSSETVLRWEQEALRKPERPKVGSLLKPVPPVRRYCDVVRHLVQTLALAGFPGDRSTASHIARAGLRLSRRTVGRIRKEQPIGPIPHLPSPSAACRAVRARFPHHVWMLDLTEIPGLLRFFSFRLAVVVDVFSRLPLAAKVFLSEPSSRDIVRLFAAAARRFGPPRHSVSDQGPQFRRGVLPGARPPRRALPLRRHRQVGLNRRDRALLPDPHGSRPNARAACASQGRSRAQADHGPRLLRLVAPAPVARRTHARRGLPRSATRSPRRCSPASRSARAMGRVRLPVRGALPGP
jgi:hypothetical protein